jgi:hypothetical protein
MHGSLLCISTSAGQNPTCLLAYNQILLVEQPASGGRKDISYPSILIVGVESLTFTK